MSKIQSELSETVFDRLRMERYLPMVGRNVTVMFSEEFPARIGSGKYVGLSGILMSVSAAGISLKVSFNVAPPKIYSYFWQQVTEITERVRRYDIV